MRVVLLVNGLGKAGAELQAVQLAEHLVSAGHTVRVVTFLSPGDLALRLEASDIEVSSLGVQPLLALLRLVRLLRRERPDVMLTLLFQANVIGLVAGALARTPRIVTSIRNEWFGGRRREVLLRLLLPLGDLEVVNSRRAASSLIERNVLRKGRVEVIYNGLDIDRLAAEPGARERVRAELKIADHFVWLCPARLISPQKGHRVLFDAFATALRDRPDQVLLLAGDGRDRDLLQEHAVHLGLSDAVRFLGERSDIADLLAAADAVVLASAWEGMPNAVMEAMGMRRPVVATAVGGTPELVDDGVTGFLVPAGDAGALTVALAKVAAMPSDQRAALGDAGRERIEKIADLGRIGRRWEASLQRSVRVALFVPSLAGGGAQRSFMTVAAELAHRSVDSCLVVGSATGEFAGELSPDVRLIDLAGRGTTKAVPALVRFLRAEKPGILISTLDIASVCAIIARWIARTDTTLVVRTANTMSISASNAGLDAQVVQFAARRLFPRADALVAPSRGAADDLARWLHLPEHEVEVLPNPVVGPALFAARSKPVDHPWFGDDGPPVVMACTRMEPHKGLLPLIRAFADVVRSRPAAKLLILGEGRQRQILEDEVAGLGLELGPHGEVHMPGFDPNPFRYMARVSAFVLASEWEGLPGVLIQALASGARVVATDCPSGPREILQGGRFGRLVPVGDEEALAQAILATLDDAAAGRNPPVPDAWKPYEVETAIDAYTELINRLDSRAPA